MFYAIWKSGGKGYICRFERKQERDKKTGENPDFKCIDYKTARKLFVKGRWYNHDTFCYALSKHN